MTDPATEPVPVETLNKLLWKIPNVLCLVGSRHGDEWNGMTQSWVTQVSMEPALVAIGVEAKAVTNRLIRDGGSFTINLWDREEEKSTPEEGGLVISPGSGTPEVIKFEYEVNVVKWSGDEGEDEGALSSNYSYNVAGPAGIIAARPDSCTVGRIRQILKIAGRLEFGKV